MPSNRKRTRISAPEDTEMADVSDSSTAEVVTINDATALTFAANLNLIKAAVGKLVNAVPSEFMDKALGKLVEDKFRDYLRNAIAAKDAAAPSVDRAFATPRKQKTPENPFVGTPRVKGHGLFNNKDIPVTPTSKAKAASAKTPHSNTRTGLDFLEDTISGALTAERKVLQKGKERSTPSKHKKQKNTDQDESADE